MSIPPTRRQFIQQAGLAALATALPQSLRAAETAQLPFENGERRLVQFPQKRPLILLTHRPPQLETPFAVFNDGVLTPNDAFFVRYHLSGVPASVDPATFRLEVKGEVERTLSLSLDEIKKLEPVEIVAVNQCSGNSRGFSSPRVGGGQWAHGAMGNARWKGARLKDVLERAGLKASAKHVAFNGLDAAPLPQTPDYVKALDLDHALGGDCLVAYEMNGEPLPMLNGFPLRLVVPGFYATYWMKHLSEIQVLPAPSENFWMTTAYKIPTTPDGCIPPGTTPEKTVPIGRMNVRSFITSVEAGAKLSAAPLTLRGIAFDGGSGIAKVEVSADSGATWQNAQLGTSLGNYSFREWTLPLKPRAGKATLLSRATNNRGEVQPMTAGWNPNGYLRNVVEQVEVTFA